jgi:HD superfamily phosphodiesterase
MKLSVTSDVIEILRAGASIPMFSVNDWAARFDSDDPEHFVDQMRLEWLPAAPPDALCKDMLTVAKSHVLDAPSGGPHLWAHIWRVTGSLLALAPEADVRPAYAFMMGIFHDVAKLDAAYSRLSHEELGARIVRTELGKHYTVDVIGSITSAILKEADSVYGWLLHDADKLDKIGATGIARRISTSPDPGYLPTALRKLRDDLRDFPAMHFPTSQRLASLKKDFTRKFLTSVIG